jgi:hypothetical protein
MKPTLALAFLSILAGARVASAQPGAPATPTPDDVGATTPATEPAPPSTSTATAMPAPTPAPVAVESNDRRPDGFSIGMGLGWDLPTSIEQPNVTSVRFRLASGLTFEPMATIAGSTASTNDGNGNTTTNKTGDLDVSALVRYPHKVHDRVDLVLVGAAGIGVHTVDPDGDNNNTTTTELKVSWGLGLDYWISPHWSVSFTATNPLIDSQHTSAQQVGTSDRTTSTTSFGLIWDPNVVLMTHLYL